MGRGASELCSPAEGPGDDEARMEYMRSADAHLLPLVPGRLLARRQQRGRRRRVVLVVQVPRRAAARRLCLAQLQAAHHAGAPRAQVEQRPAAARLRRRLAPAAQPRLVNIGARTLHHTPDCSEHAWCCPHGGNPATGCACLDGQVFGRNPARQSAGQGIGRRTQPTLCGLPPLQCCKGKHMQPRAAAPEALPDKEAAPQHVSSTSAPCTKKRTKQHLQSSQTRKAAPKRAEHVCAKHQVHR